MYVVITDSNESLEPCLLTGASLLWDGHDLPPVVDLQQLLIFNTFKLVSGRKGRWERKEMGRKIKETRVEREWIVGGEGGERRVCNAMQVKI